MVKAGIVGLPNVGKSTLFNALSNNRGAESANYPFCTIEPNSAIVEVPDERLGKLKELVSTDKIVPAILEFVDIAGLVKGASKGEGLGNKFLANIRETDVIVHVVRAFEDGNVVHVHADENAAAGKALDPISDIEVINTELALADLEAITKAKDRLGKKVRGGDKEVQLQFQVFEKLEPLLAEGKPARLIGLPGDTNGSEPGITEEELLAIKSYGLITLKKVIYAANIAESDMASGTNEFVEIIRDYAAKEHSGVVVISAKAEEELVGMSEEEKKEFLAELGVEDSGLSKLIKETYKLLGLQTYFTAGEKEVHAWTINIGDKAPTAAGKIHTDFENGFIKAEVIGYDDFVAIGGRVKARETGKARMEGKDYTCQDGDVIEFKFAT